MMVYRKKFRRIRRANTLRIIALRFTEINTSEFNSVMFRMSINLQRSSEIFNVNIEGKRNMMLNTN